MDAPTESTLIIIEIEHKLRGYYAAYVDGNHVTTSVTPLLTTARKLAASGVPLTEELILRRRGSETTSIKSTVGKAAALTVRENARQGPFFTRWAPPGAGGDPQNACRMSKRDRQGSKRIEAPRSKDLNQRGPGRPLATSQSLKKSTAKHRKQ